MDLVDFAASHLSTQFSVQIANIDAQDMENHCDNFSRSVFEIHSIDNLDQIVLTPRSRCFDDFNMVIVYNPNPHQIVFGLLLL
jgi:hypothetical protein